MVSDGTHEGHRGRISATAAGDGERIGQWPKATVFGPVRRNGNWRLHAVVERRDDDAIAIGFAEVADLIVEHWVQRGPNDLLFEPLVFNHRHALELVIKAAIRESAARLRADGHGDVKVDRERVDDWLAGTAGHTSIALRLVSMNCS